MATLTLARPDAPPRARPVWIAGRLPDLIFVIGSSLAGYLYILLFVVFQVPASYLWWFWSVGFDGTHIFGMASRTYFDKEVRRRDRRLLFGSAIFFFSLGPVMVLAGWKGWLALLVGIWAYHHVVRQHYGFLMLYKVKNRDLAPRDNRIDQLFLYLMLAAPPFYRFFVHHPEELGLPRRAALTTAAPWVEPAMWIAVGLTALFFVRRQFERARSGAGWNVPKLLLLAGIVPLHWLTFHFLSWKAAVPTVTIVHNLQYHALIWFHNRNKYGGGGETAHRHGLIPKIVSTGIVPYAAVALLFSLAYRLPGFHLGAVSDLAFGLFCGFGLTHYYLDARIWRIRHDASLRETLRLG